MAIKNRRHHFINRAPLLAALAILSFQVAGCSKEEKAGKTPQATDAPTISANIRQSLEAYKGKVVVVDFWATWCGPCVREIPGLIQLQDKYRGQGLEIVGVSVDPITQGPGAAAVAPFVKSRGINYTIWMVNDPAALAGYDISRGIPTKYFINREGKVVKSSVGALPVAMVENEIKQLL